MANLLDEINQDLITAQKAKEETVVSTLRFLLSSVQNARIEKRGELTDGEVLVQIQKDAKKHKESIEAFEKANRAELAAKEKAELKVLEKYLPEQLGAEQVEKMVDEVIAQIRASSITDMGKVMGQVMAKVGNTADGALVSQLVKQKLSS